MPEIRFYHLQTQTEAQALPLLLSKALERGMRAVVKLRDEAQVESLNEHLWTYTADSFLPHGCARDGSKDDGNIERQPIWLTAIDENPNGAQVLFLCQGAVSEILPDFTLCCEMLDGRNPQEIEAARTRWKSYKERGFSVTYWLQTDRGNWEQKI